MFDLAVVGSGFAGSILAMIAQRLGRRVLLIERGKHPRFAIGESSTPLANLLLEELATRYDLPALLPFTKWGSWQRSRPKIACGLKRGFSFFHHRLGEPWKGDEDRSDQLLVAASPNDEVADTHWYRSDFDAFLARTAADQGVEYLDEVELDALSPAAGGLELTGSRRGQPARFSARFVIDASGPRGFLHRTLKLSEAPMPHMPSTEALYAHFRDVRPFAEVAQSSFASAPYPIDDAAMHHVFDGGWVWVLRFNNGITSAGVAATSLLAVSGISHVARRRGGKCSRACQVSLRNSAMHVRSHPFIIARGRPFAAAAGRAMAGHNCLRPAGSSIPCSRLDFR